MTVWILVCGDGTMYPIGAGGGSPAYTDRAYASHVRAILLRSKDDRKHCIIHNGCRDQTAVLHIRPVRVARSALRALGLTLIDRRLKCPRRT